MECPSTGLADFLIIIGWAASSSTFFYGGRTEEWVFTSGATERVGFLSN
jgi:hypothetical protein